MKAISTALTLVCLLPHCLFADIAPATYDGVTIRPIKNSNVEMRSEKVDIHVTDTGRAKVLASFQMFNPSKKNITLFVAFPIELKWRNEELKRQKKKPTHNFQVWVNGKRKTNLVSKKLVEKHTKYEHKMEWTGWHMTFRPGRTNIKVQYDILASPSYGIYHIKNLYYILYSGKFWKGSIGQGVVSIHFKERLVKERIRSQTKPDYYKIEGSKIVWKFQNLEPERWKDDIQLQYLPNYVYQKILKLRAKEKQEPNNAHHKIELARHYFNLGRFKGVYTSKTGKKEISEYPAMGRDLLVELLEKNPKNSEAWFVYLSNYDQYGSWGTTPRFLMSKQPRGTQIKLIRKAYKLCPKHQGIRLWSDYASRKKGAQEALRKYTEQSKVYYVKWE